MHIYAMRHGESEYNVLGLCNDDPRRNVRLTEAGRSQAERAAKLLQTVPLDKIFCSQLPRARETAEIVGGPHAVTIEAHAGLNDIRSGCDGKPVEEYFRLTGHDRLNTCVGDGETLLEYKKRVMLFLDWLQSQMYLENVLLVTHEETLRVFAAYSDGLTDEEMMELTFENCQTIEFEYSG